MNPPPCPILTVRSRTRNLDTIITIIVSQKISTASDKMRRSFTFHITETGLLSLTCKDLLQMENEKINNIMEKWLRHKKSRKLFKRRYANYLWCVKRFLPSIKTTLRELLFQIMTMYLRLDLLSYHKLSHTINVC